MINSILNYKKFLQNDFLRIRNKIRYYLKFLSYLLVVIILSILHLMIMTSYLQPVNDMIRFAITDFTSKNGCIFTKLEIMGQVNVSTEEILKALNISYGEPLLNADISYIQNKLSKNLFVKDVLVIRKFPNIITVSIIENKPIAIWQFKKKLYLINDIGEIITDNNIKNFNKFSNLPYFIGKGANIYSQELLNILSNHIMSFIKYYVRYGNRRWDFILNNGTVIKMPEDKLLDAINYLDQLNIEGKLLDSKNKIIDLRVLDKYYIQKR